MIDEIGKMELFSHSFQQAVKELLKHPKVTVFATIPAPGKANPFVEEIRHRDDVSVFTVSIAISPYVCFSYVLVDSCFTSLSTAVIWRWDQFKVWYQTNSPRLTR